MFTAKIFKNDTLNKFKRPKMLYKRAQIKINLKQMLLNLGISNFTEYFTKRIIFIKRLLTKVLNDNINIDKKFIILKFKSILEEISQFTKPLTLKTSDKYKYIYLKEEIGIHLKNIIPLLTEETTKEQLKEILSDSIIKSLLEQPKIFISKNLVKDEQTIELKAQVTPSQQIIKSPNLQVETNPLANEYINQIPIPPNYNLTEILKNLLNEEYWMLYVGLLGSRIYLNQSDIFYKIHTDAENIINDLLTIILKLGETIPLQYEQPNLTLTGESLEEIFVSLLNIITTHKDTYLDLYNNLKETYPQYAHNFLKLVDIKDSQKLILNYNLMQPLTIKTQRLTPLLKKGIFLYDSKRDYKQLARDMLNGSRDAFQVYTELSEKHVNKLKTLLDAFKEKRNTFEQQVVKNKKLTYDQRQEKTFKYRDNFFKKMKEIKQYVDSYRTFYQNAADIYLNPPKVSVSDYDSKCQEKSIKCLEWLIMPRIRGIMKKTDIILTKEEDLKKYDLLNHEKKLALVNQTEDTKVLEIADEFIKEVEELIRLVK